MLEENIRLPNSQVVKLKYRTTLFDLQSFTHKLLYSLTVLEDGNLSLSVEQQGKARRKYIKTKVEACVCKQLFEQINSCISNSGSQLEETTDDMGHYISISCKNGQIFKCEGVIRSGNLNTDNLIIDFIESVPAYKELYTK